MDRDEQAVFLRSQPQECRAQQRPGRQVERLPRFSLGDLRHLLRALRFGKVLQV